MKRWLKWIGLAFGGIVALVLVAVVVLYVASSVKMRRMYEVVGEPLTAPSDSASIARGKHIAVAIAKCTDCHGEDLGGAQVVDAPVFARLASANLTRGRGGIGAELTDSVLELAVRHGVGRTGRALRFMPSEAYTHLTNQDLGALIAYVKTVPAVDREFPEARFGPVGRGLFLAGRFPLVGVDAIDHDKPHPPSVVPEVTAEYGRYLAVVGGCTGCHGPALAGAPAEGPEGTPPASNLTPRGIGHWTEADFFTALRLGKRPDGSAIDPFMPWKAAGQMTDDEIRAVWKYLQSVPAKEFGSR